jgi:hypothetical protein
LSAYPFENQMRFFRQVCVFLGVNVLEAYWDAFSFVFQTYNSVSNIVGKTVSKMFDTHFHTYSNVQQRFEYCRKDLSKMFDTHFHTCSNVQQRFEYSRKGRADIIRVGLDDINITFYPLFSVGLSTVNIL